MIHAEKSRGLRRVVTSYRQHEGKYIFHWESHPVLKKECMKTTTRRDCIRRGGKAIITLAGSATMLRAAEVHNNPRVPVFGHLWVYASRFPPLYDCTSILEDVFQDFHYAGIDGVEVMEVNLRHDDAVARMRSLINKYQLPVSGTSYGGELWNRSAHPAIQADVELVIGRLHQLGGRTMGISVGNAGHVKTPAELDAQADILKKIMAICARYSVAPNLHNHTYEVENNMHDLRGTLSRIPNIKLGPDLNWLIRAGIDPVQFIDQYGEKITYLHIRDQQADGEWTEALGEGVTNFKAIAAALKRARFQGAAAIELAFPPHYTQKRPLKEDWKISREFVKRHSAGETCRKIVIGQPPHKVGLTQLQVYFFWFASNCPLTPSFTRFTCQRPRFATYSSSFCRPPKAILVGRANVVPSRS
jgi:sugar phosphate isomerase/epimerase